MRFEQPPAIVEKSTRDWKFYQNSILKLDADRGRLLKEYKEGGTWKENYKSWAAACVPLELSKRQVDKLIFIETEKEVGTSVPIVADSQYKKEQKALSQVEKAREVAPEPKEEPEKPAVHSADEAKPATNGHVKPKDNGKAKTALPIWKEIEEDIFGRGFRRVDDLNRVCPNPPHHKRLITAIKMAHGILDEWRRDTK